MTASKLEYLDEYGDMSFDDRPFGDADSLVLSQLSYLKYDDLIGEHGVLLLRLFHIITVRRDNCQDSIDSIRAWRGSGN